MCTFLFSIEQDGRTSPLNQNNFNVVIFFKVSCKEKRHFV